MTATARGKTPTQSITTMGVAQSHFPSLSSPLLAAIVNNVVCGSVGHFDFSKLTVNLCSIFTGNALTLTGGWTDSENVIEGHYEHFCGENSPVGCSCAPPSCAATCPRSCPDARGQQQNCSLKFNGNWLLNASLDQHEQCSSIVGNDVSGTVNISAGAALPIAAKAVIAEAGPRKAAAVEAR
jgi:hypothetical protein